MNFTICMAEFCTLQNDTLQDGSCDNIKLGVHFHYCWAMHHTFNITSSKTQIKNPVGIVCAPLRAW